MTTIASVSLLLPCHPVFFFLLENSILKGTKHRKTTLCGENSRGWQTLPPSQLNAIDMYPRTLVLHLIEDNNDWKISCSGIIINLGKQV